MKENILALLKNGKVVGYKPEKPKIISTLISNIFIFIKNRKVIKVYKSDNLYWNKSFTDLSDLKKFDEFINTDFKWNKYFNTDIYIQTASIDIGSSFISFKKPIKNSLQIIEMNLIDKNDFLIEKLQSEEMFFVGDAWEVGKQFANLKTKFNMLEAKDNTTYNWYKNLKIRIDDMSLWLINTEKIPEDIKNSAINFMVTYLEKNKKRLERTNEKDIVNSIDAHAENATYINNKLGFIDIYLPKKVWRYSLKELDFFRIGLDILVIKGQNFYNSYLQGVESVTTLDYSDLVFYNVYICSAMCCMQYSISKKTTTVADKYLHHLCKLL